MVRVPDPSAESRPQGSENYKTQQKGSVREYESPALTQDKTYTFHLRARWTQNGQPVEAAREVQARAGQQVTVDFTAPQREQVPVPKEDGSASPGARPCLSHWLSFSGGS